MSKRNRSRSGAQVTCPHCGRKLRGEKGLKMHVAEAHADVKVKASGVKNNG